VPTLTPDQAKAVLAHHLGEGVADFEEMPADENLWGHLVGAWNGVWGEEKERRKARVVIVEGGVVPQGELLGHDRMPRNGRSCRTLVADCVDVLPTTLPQSPSFYLAEGSGTLNLLAPYFHRAQQFLDHVLNFIPSTLKEYKDTFDLIGTSESTFRPASIIMLAIRAG
jgi:hypothetical protein